MYQLLLVGLGLLGVWTPVYLNQKQQYYQNDPLFHPPEEEPERRLILVIKGTGLCSQIINTLLKALYFQETQNRTAVILDESLYGRYRRNQVGFWEGFLTPQFLGVLNNLPHKVTTEADKLVLHIIQQEWLQPSTDYFAYQKATRVHNPHQVDVMRNPVIIRIIPHSGYTLNRKIRQHYHMYLPKIFPWMPTQWTVAEEFYQKFVQFGCPHLRFNQQARTELDLYQRERLGNDNPLLDAFSYPNASSPPLSVAFHIRRGDKVGWRWLSRIPVLSQLAGESRFFPAEAYVDKMLQVLQRHQHDNMPQYCLVASDDYAAVEELRGALQRRQVPCILYALTQPTQTGNRGGLGTNTTLEYAKALHFFAELDLLVRATYFVGTFNSNVATVAAMMRGCQCCYNYEAGTFAGTNPQAAHFAHTYGVDRDFFFIV